MVLLRIYKHELKLDNTWEILKAVARSSPGVTIMVHERTATLLLPPTETLKIPKKIISKKGELSVVLAEVYGKVVIEDTQTYWNISHAASNTIQTDSLIFRFPLSVESEEEEAIIDVALEEEIETVAVAQKKTEKPAGIKEAATHTVSKSEGKPLAEEKPKRKRTRKPKATVPVPEVKEEALTEKKKRERKCLTKDSSVQEKKAAEGKKKDTGSLRSKKAETDRKAPAEVKEQTGTAPKKRTRKKKGTAKEDEAA